MNRSRRALCLTVCIGLVLSLNGDERKEAVVEGGVTYTGPVPRPIPIPEAMSERHLVERDAKTNGLKDAVVWIVGAKPPAKKPEKPAAFVDQRDFAFKPHVLAVEAGQEVEFFNSDGANHGVRASCDDGKNCFNVVTPASGSHKHRFVPAREAIKIDCPLHGPMAAWIYVFEHPWYAVTDKEGRFKLPPLPAGTYTMHVRHATGGMYHKRPLVVKAGQDQKLTIAFGKDDLKVPK